MKAADRLLQRWRIRRALAWLAPGSDVLDVGSADGEFFARAGGLVRSGVGVDVAPVDHWQGGAAERRRGTFPDALLPGELFDAIVMLAVVEHVEETELKTWARECFEHLRPGGRVVITVPSPFVDTLLHVGIALRLLDGMEAHQHHGFVPQQLPEIFGTAGLQLLTHRRFQLGLNNLFVFHRPP